MNSTPRRQAHFPLALVLLTAIFNCGIVLGMETEAQPARGINAVGPI